MQSILASARGVFSGWLLAGTAALLTQPATIAAGQAVALHERARIVLAVAELLGAVLFAFQAAATAGFFLLMAAFAFAAALHARAGEVAWLLALYALAAATLLYATRRAQRAAAG